MYNTFKIIVILTLSSPIFGNNQCHTPNCVANNLEFSKILNHMDLSVNPCDNFYKFACGNYESFPATSRRVRFSNQLQKLNNERSNNLDETITQLLSSGTQFKPYKIVRSLFNSCQDFKTNINDENGEESLETLEKIVTALGDWPVLVRNWNDNFNWMESIVKAQTQGFFKLSFLFSEVQQNNFDGSLQILVTPPDLEYYNQIFKSTKRYSELLEAYTNFMIKVSQELGADEFRSREELLQSLSFELKLAEGIIKESSENLTVFELTTRWPRIQWIELFRLTIPDFVVDLETPVEIKNPQYISTLEKLISETPKRVQANYFVWKIIQESIPYVKSPNLNELRRSYWHLVYSSYALPQINCVEVIKHFLPFSIYAAFIRDHGDFYSKSEAANFISKIARKFEEIVGTVEWFDEETKREAIDKVKFMSRVPGYINLPGDNFLEEFYSSLEISDDYLKNYQNLNLFIMRNRVRIVKKPFYTQDLLDVFTYYHIPMLKSYSARYLPSKNVIDISPGVLQGFFYNIDRPNYINYGRAGTIIGHEMGHAFDTINRYLDKNGFSNNWWSEKTNNTYLEKARCFAERYNHVAELLGVKVNGSRSIDESLADNIGVKIAYLAYQDYLKKNGADPVLPQLRLYSNNQLFWLSFASQLCSIPQTSGTSRHISADLRVLGAVSNIQEFSNDFKCSVGSNMNPVDKCKIF